MPAMVTVVSPEMIVDFVNGRLDSEEAETVRSVIASDDRAKSLAEEAHINRRRTLQKLVAIRH